MRSYRPEEMPSHESFGVIGLCHASASGDESTRLFNSPVPCHRVVILTIKKASISQTDYHDTHISGGEIIAEVVMSPIQFAELLTTPNTGDGVPCTLKHYRDGQSLKFCDAPPRQETEAGRVRRELKANIAEQLASLKAIRRRIEDRLKAARVPAAARAELTAEIDGLIRTLVDSAPFVMERFEEHTEEVVIRAKAEVAAYVEGVARDTGMAQIRGMVPTLEIAAEAQVEEPSGR